MIDLIIFFLGVGVTIGFALGSVVWIMYYTSLKKRQGESYRRNAKKWETSVLIGAVLLSCIINHYVIGKFTHAIEHEKYINSYDESLYWFEVISYVVIIPISSLLAYRTEAKAVNRFIFKGFMLALTNTFLVVVVTSILCYQIAIEENNYNLMNYGSLFLASGSLIGTLFIASLQVKDLVE